LSNFNTEPGVSGNAWQSISKPLEPPLPSAVADGPTTMPTPAPSPTPTPASNTTTIGSLTLTPTYETISVYSNFTGDGNANNQAVLEYRQVGATDWKTGVAMTPDRRTQLSKCNYDTGLTYYEDNPWKNQWRAVIFFLNPDTQYEVRVTYSDPDGGSGAVTATTRTLNDNPSSTGTTFYVSVNGTDSNNGLSTSSPFKTVQKAVDTASAGSKILLLPGSFTEEITINKSGAVGNFISLQSYNTSNKATINGQITLQNAAFIRISTLNLNNPSAREQIADVYFSHSHDIIVENNTMYYLGAGWGASAVFFVDPPNYNVLIQNNSITGGTTNAERFGISAWGDGNYAMVLRGNSIVGPGMKDGFSGDWYTDTFIHNNYVEGTGDDIIEFEGINTCNAAWSNTCKGTGGLMSFATAPVIVGPYYVFRNTFIGANDAGMKMGNSSEGYTYVYHNTFYARSGTDGLAFFGNNAMLNNLIMRNNVIDVDHYVIENYEASTDWGKEDLDYDNMLSTSTPFKWRDITYNSLSAFQSATGYESHGISADSKFVNPSGDDFHLQSSSPNIDKGVILIGFNDANSPWPYKGSAPDMGAYEYDPGTPTNSPPELTPSEQ
jgi:hypothetical protein